MDFLVDIIEWIIAHQELLLSLFSGIGIAVITLLWAIGKSIYKAKWNRKPEAEGDIVTGDKMTIINQAVSVEAQELPKPTQFFEPELVEIPAGTFIMGDDERGPWGRHSVTLPAFQIGKYPITNQQYLAYIEKTGVAVSSKAGWELAPVGQKPAGDKMDHPLVGVSWDEAVAYCVWLTEQTGRHYRLPSEAEWERAARGADDTRAYPWGDDFSPNRCNQGGIGLTSVRQHSPAGDSPAGCADLAGNVWEWTATQWGRDKDAPEFTYPYPTADKLDGRHDPPAQGAMFREYRICRGGSFKDQPERLRCSSRTRVLADSQHARRGFRVACDLS